MSFNLLEEASRILEINSITYESNLPVVEYLCKLLEPFDVEIQKQSATHFEKPQANLIVRKGPKEGKMLLFNSHLDTVSAGDFSLWDRTGGNPFRATVDQDKIFGLGAADVKLDALCKLKALEKFINIPFKNPFVWVGTYGEESGLVGARQILESKIVKPTYAVIGEPSNLNIIHAHKGHLVVEICLEDKKVRPISKQEKILRCDFLGKAAHSSTPHLGENAIEELFNFLKTMPDLSLVSIEGGHLINVIAESAVLKGLATQKITPNPKKFTASEEENSEKGMVFSPHMTKMLITLYEVVRRYAHAFKKTPLDTFDPPYSLLSCNVLKTQSNQITLQLSIRTLPNLDTNAWFLGFSQEIEKVKQNQEDINILVKNLRESKPMETSISSTLVREARHILQQMGLQDIVATKATSTEASIYAQMGAEAIVWGPGISVGNVHRPNEFNYSHHLNKAVIFYEKLIESFCVKGA